MSPQEARVLYEPYQSERDGAINQAPATRVPLSLSFLIGPRLLLACLYSALSLSLHLCIVLCFTYIDRREAPPLPLSYKLSRRSPASLFIRMELSLAFFSPTSVQRREALSYAVDRL